MISGGCDTKVFITSVYISGVDEKKLKDYSLPFPVGKFGEVICKVNTKAWVNCVMFMPSGKYSFAGSHNSTLSIIRSEGALVQTLNLSHSPAARILALDQESIMVIGYDRHFYKYSCANQSKKWKYVSSITKNDMNKTNIDTSEKKEDGASFKDKIGVFKSLLKKTSLVVTTTKNAKNIHFLNICSASIIANRLITADLVGYIKL